MPLPSDAGLGKLVALPLASYAGSGQAVPTVSPIPVISLTGLWVRVCVRGLCTVWLNPDQLPVPSSVQSWVSVGLPVSPVLPTLSSPSVERRQSIQAVVAVQLVVLRQRRLGARYFVTPVQPVARTVVAVLQTNDVHHSSHRSSMIR